MKKLIFRSVVLLLVAITTVGVRFGCDTTVRRGEPELLYHHVLFPDQRADGHPGVALTPGVPTTLSYRLSNTPGAQTGETVQQVSVPLWARLQRGNSVMDVIFRCSICADDQNRPTRRLAVKLDAIESDTLVFRFTPTSGPHRVDQLTAPKGVALVFMIDGVLLDRMDLSVHVQEESTAGLPRVLGALVRTAHLWETARGELVGLQKTADAGPAGPNPKVLAHAALSSHNARQRLEQSDSRPDVVIFLERDHDRPFVRVAIDNPALQLGANPTFQPSKMRFADPDRQDSPGPRPVYFYPSRAGMSWSGIRSDMLVVFERLWCLTASPRTPEGKQFRDKLMQDLRQCTFEGAAGDHWTAEQAERIGHELAAVGDAVFYDLFSNDALAESMKRLASPALTKMLTRPVRISFNSDYLEVPLQIIYCDGPRDYDAVHPAFLGLRVELSAPVLDADVPIGISVFPQPKWHTVFGAFGGDHRPQQKEQDLVVTMADQHYKEVLSTVTGSGGSTFEKQVSGDGFVKSLTGDHQNVGLIWTYAHGDGRGWSVDRYGDLPTVPRIIFGWAANGSMDSVTPPMIDEALRQVRVGAAAPLVQGPLVVLIACESGIAGLGGSSALTLVSSFMTYGARGVISTESEVNAASATVFGATLIKHLPTTAPSLAILLTRQKRFDSDHDLWPLLFRYTGAPGAFGGP